ncbi:hypothetical protein DH2020_042151 [Rehmannia glutinosa]|uniref:Exonuclease 1 n=1 Tax=Rehmannia glutinosa TaxID=99300 RepID=A0ABR0UQB7_REHGL
MGIQGLLPLLKSIMNPIHIKELEGCFVAVDTYSWLHKGALSCSTELCKGQPTSKHINYCMHRVNMLRHYGVKPILVFDGGPLPMKSEQEIKRARSRRENLSRAVEHEANGNRSAAYECYQKAVDISPSVAYDLIQVLKQENVSYVVAPYEADAQMTFLALSKQVDAVITEDSDLIAFGCPRVIKHLKYNNVEVTPQYEESFKKAILTFRHQRVYDPISEDIVYLSEPADIIGEDLDFLAKGIAQGDLDPFTKVPIQGESGDTEKVLHGTYQLKNFKPDGERKKLDLPAQKNLLINYFCFASLEAKRNFRAPRITPNNPNERNETSSHRMDVHEVKHGAKTDDLKLTILQNSVCKPCISLHKDLDSDRETGKATFVNKNGVVRSSYFIKKSREENGKENKSDVAKNIDNKLDDVISNHVYEPISKTSRKEEKRVTVKSPYFRHKTENANCEVEKSKEEYSVATHRFDFDAGDKTTVDNGKHGGSVPESEDLVIKKRKIAQTDSPTEDANENNWQTGTCTSDLEEEDTKAEEGKMACNISHLGRYSDIAEKSMEKFVSVISSFRYSSSGSRASGLRAPLKDIKNNICMKSSTLDVDLRKFVYAPAKKTTSRCHKSPEAD